MEDIKDPTFSNLLAEYCDLVSKMAELEEKSAEWKKWYDIMNNQSMKMIRTAQQVYGDQCKTK